MPDLGNKLRIAVGGLTFEGNSLSPVVADYRTCERFLLKQGEELVRDLAGKGTEMSGALYTLGLSEEVEVIPLIDADLGSAGRVDRGAYERLRGMLLDRLRAAAPIDGLYLRLHGAFVVEGENDIEGGLLKDARRLVGEDVPIAVSLDLHGNITPEMAAHATFMIGYRHYPHDDCFDTGRRTVGLLLQTLRGRIDPVMRVRKVPLLAGCQNQRTKGHGPLVDLHAKARAREATGEVLAASYFPVQHGLDFSGTSFGVVAVSDGDPEAADRVALELARDVWDRRHDFDVPTLTPEAAISRGLATDAKPIVLSEGSDCVGGGAYGDSTIVLKALLEHAGGASACILIVDPETVGAAKRTGVGGNLSVRIGNKHSAWYGRPLAVEAKVVGLLSGRFTYATGCYEGLEADMGPSALLEVGGVKVVVSSQPTYEQAAEFKTGSPLSTKLIKDLLYRGLTADVDEHMTRHLEALKTCFRSEDHKEGVAAFLEKREARFVGR